jgi:hypothetical protein
MLQYKTSTCPLKNAEHTLFISDDENAMLLQYHLSETFKPHNHILNPQHIENVKIYLNFSLPYSSNKIFYTK